MKEAIPLFFLIIAGCLTIFLIAWTPVFSLTWGDSERAKMLFLFLVGSVCTSLCIYLFQRPSDKKARNKKN